MSGVKATILSVGIVHSVISILIEEGFNLPASINNAAERSQYGITSKKKILLIINLLIKGLDSDSNDWVSKDADLMGFVVSHILYMYKSHKDIIKEKLIRTLECATTRTEDGEWREDRYLVVMDRLKILNMVFDMIEDLTLTPLSEWIKEDGITLLKLRY